MIIGIGNDHSGVELKKQISAYINEKYGYEVINFGTDSNDSCNYPEYGEKVAKAIVNKQVDKGIVICGTGIGISLAANKVRGIRCATVSEPVSARLSVEHNNANMIGFGARIIGEEEAKAIVDAFLTSEFQGGRHQTRVDMIMDIEERESK